MLIFVAALTGATIAYTVATISDAIPQVLFWMLLLASGGLGIYLIIRHRTDPLKTSDFVGLLGAFIGACIGVLGILNTGGDGSPTPTLAPTPAAVVPDVVLLSRNDAIAQLDTAGLPAAVICQDSPSVEATGVVYATTPSAFKRVEPGTEVKLYVNPPCAAASGTASPPG